MPALSPTLTRTLEQARSAWLDGDRAAWTRYAECCLRLEAELRRETAAPRPLPSSRPRTRPDRRPAC